MLKHSCMFPNKEHLRSSEYYSNFLDPYGIQFQSTKFNGCRIIHTFIVYRTLFTILMLFIVITYGLAS